MAQILILDLVMYIKTVKHYWENNSDLNPTGFSFQPSGYGPGSDPEISFSSGSNLRSVVRRSLSSNEKFKCDSLFTVFVSQ